MNSVRQIKRVYYLVTFFTWLAVALPLSLIVLFMQARGLSLFQIGLLFAAYSMAIVLLELPTGGLADSIGRKKVAAAALIFNLSSFVVIVFAFSFAAFLLAWILGGIGRALSSGALDAWYVDELQALEPDIDLQPALAAAGNVTLAALALGTLTGGLIPQLFGGLPTDGAAILTPLVLPIIVGCFSIIAALIALIVFVRESGRERAGELSVGFRNVIPLVKTALKLSRQSRILPLLFAGSFAIMLTLTSIENLWQPHFAGLIGAGAERSAFFGVVMGVTFFAGILGNVLATNLSRLLNKRYALVSAIAHGMLALLLLFLALADRVSFAVIFFWLLYLTLGLTNSPQNTFLNNEIPSEQRSAMLSINSLVGYAGSIFGAAGLSLVAERANIPTAWMLAAALMFLSVAFYLRVDSRVQKTAPATSAAASEKPIAAPRNP